MEMEMYLILIVVAVFVPLVLTVFAARVCSSMAWFIIKGVIKLSRRIKQ